MVWSFKKFDLIVFLIEVLNMYFLKLPN